MPRGRAGVVLGAALLIVAGAAAIGWLALYRHRGPETQAVAGGTVSSRSSAGSTGDARDGTTGSAAGATLPPDDWMQPYRGMTPDQAFDEVARRVRFEPYAGIQRGARGTARARAGNAIDQALLLAGILRAAGHEVRLVHGSLSPQNTAAILRGLYPPRVESAAFDAAYLPYEATADSGLGALVRDHYWVEVNQGSTWLPLDPSFPRAKIGEAYGTAADRFAEPPADLYQRIELAWKIDTRDRGGQQVARWSGTVADVGLLPISLVVDAIPGSRKEAAPSQPSAGGMFGGALTGGPPPKPAGEQPAADRPPAAIRVALPRARGAADAPRVPRFREDGDHRSPRIRERAMKTIPAGLAAAILVVLVWSPWDPALAGFSRDATQGQMNEVDLVSLDLGGHVETITSEIGEGIGGIRLIDGNPRTYWLSNTEVKYPAEIVFSFFGRQRALVQAVVIEPGNFGPARPKDVEVWTSSESATGPFTKVAAFTVLPASAAQSFPIPPVETRYLKLSILTNYGDKRQVGITKVKVIEGTRAGYQPLLARSPDLVALAAGRAPDRWAASRPAAGPAVAPMASCEVPRDASAERPAHPQSSNVLIIAGDVTDYPPLRYAATNDSKLARMNLRRIRPTDARPVMLAEAEAFDTIVLSQLCDIDKTVSAAFRQLLPGWVAMGHKLVIHDSDMCGGTRTKPPDYGFLPYPFATSNPGARGAHSDVLDLVEQSALAHGNASHAGYVDIESWKKRGNELGDSNTLSQWDTHWCGVFVGLNSLGVYGFEEAYAHHGRGLIVYDGFDKDQMGVIGYRQLVTHELLVPFDPDPLPCNVRLGQFVITTDARLNTQSMTAGRSYTYPLTVLSNQGYKGRVKLSLTPSPADPGISGTFQPDTIDVSDKASSALTVTTTAAARRGAHALTVRGVDAAGKTSMLCLNLVERKTGGLKVTTALGSSKKTGKNLEIILDESGSMKLALGKSTRIGTARKVLGDVLAKIPDDFNVGLRLYGDRFASNQKQTCTDSHLVVPIQKLNRARILSIVGATKPRGETPLVYSVLQTINDLKSAGGGSVVLITDGEESCHGDPVAAAAALRNSGLDVSLNIVGFTLKAKQSQQALATLASSTGGRFYGAQDGEALGRVLLAAAVHQFPFTVLDAGGKVVASGQAGGDGVELPPGQYRVVVTAGDEEVVANAVTVGTGTDVTLTVGLKDGRFAIVRQ